MSEKKYVVIPFEDAETAAAFINSADSRVRVLQGARILDADEYPTKRYNGWTNYETWAVKLWMDNDEWSYNYWRQAATSTWIDARADAILNRDERARYNLADRLKEEHEENVPCLTGTANAGAYSDLLSAALSEVNWSEIAESLLDDVDKAEEEEEEEDAE